MRITRRTAVISLMSLIVLGLLGYWFFMHTNRGSSWALYAFAAIRAPLDVKIACAHSTDARVEEKFQLPLAFDEQSKDALRGFWYYDYYRECLYSHGYDFSGRPIPKTSLSEGVYRNPFIGIEFAVPADALLTSDNLLDVNYDDHLYTSGIRYGETTIIVHAYLKDDTKQSLDVMTGFSSLPEEVMHRELFTNSAGIAMARLTGVNGTEGFVFRTPSDWSVYIFANKPEATLIESISQSLRLLR